MDIFRQDIYSVLGKLRTRKLNANRAVLVYASKLALVNAINSVMYLVYTAKGFLVICPSYKRQEGPGKKFMQVLNLLNSAILQLFLQIFIGFLLKDELN